MIECEYISSGQIRFQSTMPPTKMDSERVLNAIAIEVSSMTNMPVQLLLADRKRLDSVLNTCEKFSWENVGQALGQPRQSIYRWYHDTHQRNLYGGVSPADINTIRCEIEVALRIGTALDHPFQYSLKQKLTKQYHRNSFTVAFNNQKRLATQKNKLNESSERQLPQIDATQAEALSVLSQKLLPRSKLTELFDSTDFLSDFATL